jgi:signal transduction histidine kinase
LLLVSAAAGYLLSRKALEPVDRISNSVRSISVSNLSLRLPSPDSGDELQRLTDTCNGMLARLEAAVNELKQFTADASHELRNPICFIRTVAEVALRNPKLAAETETCTAFSDIVGECTRAGDLLENMLTLARADSGDSVGAFEPVNLVELVRESCKKFRPIADAHGHSIDIFLDNDDTLEVTGDESSLRRLLSILLDNAAKYTKAPGLIKVRLKAVDNKATITVKDSGIGIPEADLPHIFQRFYRADPSRSQVEGTGLGLAIAKWIADIHHAEISVASKENLGTTLQITIPICRKRSDAAELTEDPLYSCP